MEPLKKRLESPSFWFTILGGLGTIAAGLTDTGNPTLIAIGTALIAVHAIGEAMVDAVKVIAPTSGTVSTIEQKAGALIPIVEQQVGNVETLIKTVGEQAKILSYRMKGYEVTPHVETTQVIPMPQGDGTSTTSHTLNVGGAHEIIGVKKP